MIDTTAKMSEHYSATGLTDRIKTALATIAPEEWSGAGVLWGPEESLLIVPLLIAIAFGMWRS